ncbi:MAG: DUF512 domain-containing protein [Candidatus Cloacimonetes bacterium]|nr:DUF512 domain-containing protein [Candidatus Cloacimonadota bacterium]
MPLTIVSVDKGSPADRADVRSGDSLFRINGQPVDDFLDLQFHGASEHLVFDVLRPDGERCELRAQHNWSRPLGIEPELHRCRVCVNDCVFCFVDQMRPGSRPSLNLKDDDPAFSFSFGNFITLTNLGRGDWRRIVSQRRSPLYVSVHTTDPALHRRMLRYPHAFNIIEALRRLDGEGIELHTQIVIVPGMNDGLALDRTLSDLLSLRSVLTVGIVPVGLTRYRQGLTPMQQVDSADARELLRQAEAANVGQPTVRVLCSDEIYLLAGASFPSAEHYDDYAQIENGIGMVRMMRENWLDRGEELIGELGKQSSRLVRKIMKKHMEKYGGENDIVVEMKEIGRFVIVTGTLAAPEMQKIAAAINDSMGQYQVRVQAVFNNYFGSTVTVAGLLTASDIRRQVKLDFGETAILPSSVFNHDGYTLDDVHRDDLYRKMPFIVVDELLHGWESIDTALR